MSVYHPRTTMFDLDDLTASFLSGEYRFRSGIRSYTEFEFNLDSSPYMMFGKLFLFLPQKVIRTRKSVQR